MTWSASPQRGRSTIKALQCSLVPQQDRTPVSRYRNDALTLELREGAGHGFNRQAQIIGDVRPAHWEIDMSVISLALSQVEQEGGDFLDGALAAEQQHVRLSPFQRAHHRDDELPGQCLTTGVERVTAAAPIRNHSRAPEGIVKLTS